MANRPERRGEDREIRTSLAFYFVLILLAGQFVANAIWHVAFNYLFLAITGAAFLGILFGPSFAIEFFRALRGSGDERGGGDE